MKNNCLSVIIPVYNAVAYIRKCVEGVIAFPNVYEIIVIDDGSTDGSSEVCDRLSAENPGLVRVIHQPNRGVSAARNYGICVAHGEWLWFVDADDQVLSVQESDCNVPSDARFVVTGFEWNEGQLSQSVGATPTDVPYNLWRCWFRRELINEYGLLFTLGRRYAEDQEFILRYLMAVGRDRVAAIAAPCYSYTLRPGSAMTRPGMKWKQTVDLGSVIWQLLKEAVRNHKLGEPWLRHQFRRLLKNLYVTIVKIIQEFRSET